MLTRSEKVKYKIIMLIFFSLFIRYVEAVFPGEFGIPKPFYFPCLPSYWTGHPHKKVSTGSTTAAASHNSY